MAKLPRVTAKVFASNAAEGDIGQYGSALAGTKVITSDISEIQALPAYEEGWRGAVISDRNYPTLQEMNGLQKTFSQQIAYTLQAGIPEWDANTEYYANTSFCQVSGVIYQSKSDNNIGNNPTTDLQNWEIYYPNNAANVDLSNLSASGQAKFDQKVNKAGDTMTGALSIRPNNAPGVIYLFNNAVDMTDNATPSANQQYGIIQFRDKNAVWAGYLQVENRTDGIRRFVMGTRRQIDGIEYAARFGIQVDQEGNEDVYTSTGVRAAITNFFAPSSKNTTFTVGTTGSYVTAPANGYMNFYGMSTATSKTFIYLGCNGLGAQGTSDGVTDQALHCYLPVKKGDRVLYTYNNADTLQLKFIYAVGG